MRQTMEQTMVCLKEIENHLGSLRNILSSDNSSQEKYLKESV